MTRTGSQGRSHLDARLARLRPLVEEPRPHRGWIRAIPDALGMSSTELAARMQVSQSTIPELERNELHDTIKFSEPRSEPGHRCTQRAGREIEENAQVLGTDRRPGREGEQAARAGTWQIDGPPVVGDESDRREPARELTMRAGPALRPLVSPRNRTCAAGDALL